MMEEHHVSIAGGWLDLLSVNATLKGCVKRRWQRTGGYLGGGPVDTSRSERVVYSHGGGDGVEAFV